MFDNIKKFINSVKAIGKVQTDTGYVNVLSIHKTIKYRVYKIVLEDGFKLKCADNHILFDNEYNEIFVKDLVTGQEVITERGLKKVRQIIKTNKFKHMYDLSIDSKDHRYYTSGILSHNTTISTIYMLHQMLFNDNKIIAILANKETSSKEILGRMIFAYERLPYWLQQGVKEWNKTSIELENGSKAFISATSSSAVRSRSISILFIDEFAHIPNGLASEFMDSTLPTIASAKTSKIILVSTSKGLNHFYNIWQGAVREQNDFLPISVSWREIPGYDEEFKKSMIANKSLTFWLQEFENAFLGSINTLIIADTLERLTHREPVELKYSGALQIWEYPKDKAEYVLGIDSAEGVGQNASVIQVIKINNDRDLEQVAVYRNNLITPYNFAQVSIEISKYYNNAICMVENNDVGGEVVNHMFYDFEFDNIINLDKTGLGIRSSGKLKLSACLFLKRYMEMGYLDLHDKTTIFELSQFAETKPGIFRAQERSDTDDCVMALIWSIFYIGTDYYDGHKHENVITTDNKLLRDQAKEIEDDGVGAMIIDNDSNNDDWVVTD